jgi:hypothetical protein
MRCQKLNLISKIRRQSLFHHAILLGRSQKTADLNDSVARFVLRLRGACLLLLLLLLLLLHRIGCALNRCR